MASNPNVVALDEHARLRARGADASNVSSLDVVARLFDHFGADPGIPESVRAELARLRIPTLRAAQVQRDFLANPAHPARRLLDAIGSAAIGLDDSTRTEEATPKAIARAVHDVLTGYDIGLDPFEAAARDLAAFLAQRTAAEDALGARVAREIEGREHEDLPRRRSGEEVVQRLRARLWVPGVVREMLLADWSRALARAHREDGEDSQAWRALLATMDDLLWSVEPKASPDGRRRLAAMLPGLIDAVSGGLRHAGVDEEACVAFLSALVDLHATAVKSGLRGMVDLPLEPEPSFAPRPAYARATFTVGDLRAEEIRLAGAEDCAAQLRPSEALAQLTLGTWIELERGARNAARKRLSWVSPATGMCLFVGVAPGSMSVAVSPAALAEQLRRGEARLIDGTALVERTIGAVLARIATPAQG
jgi:hypothetical protein